MSEKEIQAKIAEAIGKLTNRQKPLKLKGTWGDKKTRVGNKYLPKKHVLDTYGQTWEFGDIISGNISDYNDPAEGTIRLVGEQKIPAQTLLDNMTKELEVDKETWFWEFNREIDRPDEGQYWAWERPDNGNPKSPVMDIILMINATLYVVNGFLNFKDKDPNKSILNISLRGVTEQVARNRIEQWRRDQLAKEI